MTKRGMLYGGATAALLLIGLLGWLDDQQKARWRVEREAEDQEMQKRAAARHLPPPTSQPSKANETSTPSAANVRKKDGTFDRRDNDLHILCEDWKFFRERILKAAASGDEQTANDARKHFQQTNRWLDEYPDDAVAKECGQR